MLIEEGYSMVGEHAAILKLGLSYNRFCDILLAY